MEQILESQKEITESFESLTEMFNKHGIFTADIKHEELITDTNSNITEERHLSNKIMFHEQGDSPMISQKEMPYFEVNNFGDVSQKYGEQDQFNANNTLLFEKSKDTVVCPTAVGNEAAGDNFNGFLSFSKPTKTQIMENNQDLQNLDNHEVEENSTGIYLPEDYSTQENFLNWNGGSYYPTNCDYSTNCWEYNNESKVEYEQYKEEINKDGIVEGETYEEDNDTEKWIIDTEGYLGSDFYNLTNFDDTNSTENSDTLRNFGIEGTEEEAHEDKELDINEKEEERTIKKEYSFPRIKYTRNYLLQFSNCMLAYPLPESLQAFTKAHELPLRQLDIPKPPPVQPPVMMSWRFNPNMTHLEFYKKVQQDIDTRRRTAKIQD